MTLKHNKELTITKKKISNSDTNNTLNNASLLKMCCLTSGHLATRSQLVHTAITVMLQISKTLKQNEFSF